MGEKTGCTCTEGHTGHICVLRGLGLMDEIARLSINPSHVCFSCGAEVNCPNNVCQPMPLES